MEPAAGPGRVGSWPWQQLRAGCAPCRNGVCRSPGELCRSVGLGRWPMSQPSRSPLAAPGVASSWCLWLPQCGDACPLQEAVQVPGNYQQPPVHIPWLPLAGHLVFYQQDLDVLHAIRRALMSCMPSATPQPLTFCQQDLGVSDASSRTQHSGHLEPATFCEAIG